MFKKIKEYKSKYDTLRKDPKKRDLITLLLWCCFIAFLIIFLRITSSNEMHIQKNNEKIFDMTGYEFTYEFENNSISGMTYDDKMLFYKDNKKYYVNNEDVYMVHENNLIKQENYDLKILKMNYNFINNLISGISGTSAADYTIYTIPLDRFINLYEVDTDVDLSAAMNYNIVVKIYGNLDDINKIVIDLSNYYRFYGNNFDYVVNMYLTNVNNISNFSKEYDEKIGVR